MGILGSIFNLFFGKKTVSKDSSAVVQRDWVEIRTLLTGGAPSQLRQALILADRSLDAALKDLVAGETMGDRLKSAKNLFHHQTYDKVWQAHKLRNALVHESGFEAQHFVLRSSVEVFRGGLSELGVHV